jgi:hypothetical protein
MLQIALQNWNAEKVGMMIGEEPTPHFYSRVFAKYQTVVEEGLLTATQKNLQAQQMMDINASFGREVIPASMIIKDMNIQGKAQIMQMLQQQEEQTSHKQEQTEHVQHLFEDAKIKELYSKIAYNIANARERHGRSESNIGLFEERLSMITKNRASATKEKMEALSKLLETIQKFGELETYLKENQLESVQYGQEMDENREKADAKQTAESNKFIETLMSGMNQEQMPPGQEQPGMQQQQEAEMPQQM